MVYRIGKGKEIYLAQLVEIFMDTPLAAIYFKDKSPENIIARGLKNGQVFVALDEEKCVGFLLFEEQGTFGKYPYLHVLVVAEKYRQEGIGKQLINYYEEVLVEDYDKYFLMVGSYNEGAKRLYERLGYKPLCLLSDFYIDGIDEWLMIKHKE